MEKKAKRLLFVLPTAQIGGTRTSLLNLIANMDKERYHIDVMFIRNKGTVLKQFEDACNVLPQDKTLLAGRETVSVLLKSGKIGAFIKSLCFVAKSKIQKQSRYEIAYKQVAKNYDNKYDCVIAYQEKDASEFARYIKAPKKIAWVHSKYNGGAEKLRAVYDCFDKVIFVSDGIMGEYIDSGAADANRSIRIYNTFNQSTPLELCDSYKVNRFKENCPLIVSVGRCAREKGFDRVIDASLKLKKEGIDFEWVIVGGGSLLTQFKTKVEQLGLSKNVFFVGYKENPYPYIFNADFVVVSSTTESFSLVCLEAAALKKPVVVTDYPAAHEVVVDGKMGIICPNSAEGVYDGVKRMISDCELRQQIVEYLDDFNYDNQEIVEQVYQVVE